MSFDDKKFGVIFPVRDGITTGSANERQMLDAIGGANGFMTRIQDNPDGSTTMLRTKNGMPQFTTSRRDLHLQQEAEESLYMESGQLSFTFPGPENPTRANAAKWLLLDIPDSSSYLGKIVSTEGDPGAQSNTPALFDGQDSLAIAPPSPEGKKVTAATFPASLYSGKMRLFIQAQNGAKMSGDQSYGLFVDVSGSQALLKYTYAGKVIQFGLWAHLSVGIFTANDGTFWLIQISSSGGSEFKVYAFPIVILKRANRLYSIYKSGTYATGDKSKIEAYLFAHSYIDLNRQMLVGGFSGSSGSPIAYGWHFNSSGSEASIVVHEAEGVGIPHGMSLFAKTMTVSIGYSQGRFQISASTSDGVEWTDGWGVYNIFVPEEELGTRLISYSVAMDRDSVKPPFTFSGAPIYGYYKDDEWRPVEISRNMSPGGTGKSQTYENFYVPTLYAGLYPAWYYGNFLASQDWSYSYKNLTNRSTMSVSFDGLALNGESETGTFTEIQHTTDDPLGEGKVTSNDFGFYLGLGGGNGGTVNVPYTAEYAAAYNAFMRYEFPQYAAYISYKSANFTWDQVDFVGSRHLAWTIVIPGYDCEALYIARKRYVVSGSSGVRRFRSGYDKHTVIAYGSYNGKGTRYEFVGAQTCSVTNVHPTTVTNNYQTPDIDLGVLCFNSELSGVNGTPGGGYNYLFSVDYTYPFYDRGMYMRTSHGGRYIGSEGVKSPESVGNIPFVGWA